ncbi:MAG: hypothetical protein M3Y54_19820 [Bacteroidota bacterium]|nr:hypothetical protein [Bacteroidota bacterium]
MSRKFLLPVVLSGLLLPFASCQKENAPKPANAGLTGTWQLTGHQCYCTPAPLPNEQVRFDAATFAFLRNGQKTLSGTYTETVDTTFCNRSAVPAIRFQPDSGAARPVQFTLRGNTLTLDYGSPCDAPLDTYQRVAQ